jgi:hypothetical protein
MLNTPLQTDFIVGQGAYQQLYGSPSGDACWFGGSVCS